MLDDQLVTFSQKLPLTFKLKGLQLRWFFKEALRGFLPDEIIIKKKQGFGCCLKEGQPPTLPFMPWRQTH